MFRRHHRIAIAAGLLVAGSVLAAAAGLSTARLLATAKAPETDAGMSAAAVTAPLPSARPAVSGHGATPGSGRNETVIAKTSTEIWPPLLQARPVMAPRNGRAAPPRSPLAAPCTWGQCQDI